MDSILGERGKSKKVRKWRRKPKRVILNPLDEITNELESLTLNDDIETKESKEKAETEKAEYSKRAEGTEETVESTKGEGSDGVEESKKAEGTEESEEAKRLKANELRRYSRKFGIQPKFGKFKVIEGLPFYHPSDKMKDAQNEGFSMFSLIKAVPSMKKYIDSLNLQPDNIKGALKMLLQIEDLHNLLPYCSLYQKRVRVEEENGRLKFNIKVPKNINIDDVLSPEIDQVIFVPKLSIALTVNQMKYAVDKLWIHEHEEEIDCSLRRHVRTLKEIQKNTVYVNLNEDGDDDDEDEDVKNRVGKIDYEPPFDFSKPYAIIFRPIRYTFRVQHRALDLLDEEKCNFVFPSSNLQKVEAATDVKLEIINKQICGNPEQLQAVKQIVGGPNPHGPYIVVGPPGTGKTTTIVEAILQLYIQNKNNHILITAGSNSACDTVALKICEYFENESRLIKISKERRCLVLPPHDILRVFSKSWIKKIGYKNINHLIKENANFSSGDFVSPSVEALKEYNIIVVTLCTMGRLRTGIVGNWPFTHVFIDEASAITETEALVAITSVNTGSCRVILSGDTKQLGPVVMSRVAGELGLKYSLMERLLKRECYAVMPDGSYDRTLQARLRRNYRSHPEILQLFNNLYYNNELIPEVRMESLMKLNKLSIVTNNKFPIIFEAVLGNMGISESSKSSYNEAEVDKVLWIIYQLQKFTDITNIGIVSPYRLQCAQIKRKLEERDLKGIEVGTAELYQGREKPIMIASFVKSFCDLGFVADPQANEENTRKSDFQDIDHRIYLDKDDAEKRLSKDILLNFFICKQLFYFHMNVNLFSTNFILKLK